MKVLGRGRCLVWFLVSFRGLLYPGGQKCKYLFHVLDWPGLSLSWNVSPISSSFLMQGTVVCVHEVPDYSWLVKSQCTHRKQSSCWHSENCGHVKLELFWNCFPLRWVRKAWCAEETWQSFLSFMHKKTEQISHAWYFLPWFATFTCDHKQPQCGLSICRGWTPSGGWTSAGGWCLRGLPCVILNLKKKIIIQELPVACGHRKVQRPCRKKCGEGGMVIQWLVI